MGFREIKTNPISDLYEDKTDIPIQIVPQSSVTIPMQNHKITIPKSVFEMPFRPRPTPAKPIPHPAPEPEIVPKPEQIIRPSFEPVHIQEEPMGPMPSPLLNPQTQQVPPRQFIPFTPPQPTPTAQRTITLPSFSLNPNNAKKYGIAIVKFSLAIVMVWMGVTTTGSFFGPASGKFSGQLATIFYAFQLGNLLAMIGVVLAYDAIQKLR